MGKRIENSLLKSKEAKEENNRARASRSNEGIKLQKYPQGDDEGNEGVGV